jgi:hypothetical protein
MTSRTARARRWTWSEMYLQFPSAWPPGSGTVHRTTLTGRVPRDPGREWRQSRKRFHLRDPGRRSSRGPPVTVRRIVWCSVGSDISQSTLRLFGVFEKVAVEVGGGHLPWWQNDVLCGTTCRINRRIASSTLLVAVCGLSVVVGVANAGKEPRPVGPTAAVVPDVASAPQLEAQESWERMQEEMFWGGVRPSDRLRTLQANVIGLAQLDRALVDALAEADPDLQWSVARWATRRAWDAAGLSSLNWAAPALAALERGETLPAPFDDQMQVWGMLLGEDRGVQNVHVRTTGLPRIELPTNIDPQFAAMPAIFAAVEADPLRAAVDAIYAAAVTFGHGYPLLLGELRTAFPALA